MTGSSLIQNSQALPTSLSIRLNTVFHYLVCRFESQRTTDNNESIIDTNNRVAVNSKTFLFQ